MWKQKLNLIFISVQLSECKGRGGLKVEAFAHEQMDIVSIPLAIY